MDPDETLIELLMAIEARHYQSARGALERLILSMSQGGDAPRYIDPAIRTLRDRITDRRATE